MTADTPAPEPLGQRAERLAALLASRKPSVAEWALTVTTLRDLAAANAALVKERDFAVEAAGKATAEAQEYRSTATERGQQRDAALASAERLEEALASLVHTRWVDGPNAENIINADVLAAARAALATEPPMAAPISSHQHGGENARQQGGEEGIAPFSPPDTLAPEPPQ